MPRPFLFELVSPEKLLFSGEVDMVTIPGEEGDFGVLAEHAPLISTVRPGVLKVYEGTAVVQEVFVSGGFAEVTQTRCTLLADSAIEVAKIDRAEAEKQASWLEEEAARLNDPIEQRLHKTRLAVARAKVAAAA